MNNATPFLVLSPSKMMDLCRSILLAAQRTLHHHPIGTECVEETPIEYQEASANILAFNLILHSVEFGVVLSSHDGHYFTFHANPH